MIYEYEQEDEYYYRCDCGWEGDLENLGALGIEGDGGCCPDCGCEEFVDGDKKQG